MESRLFQNKENIRVSSDANDQNAAAVFQDFDGMQ